MGIIYTGGGDGKEAGRGSANNLPFSPPLCWSFAYVHCLLSSEEGGGGGRLGGGEAPLDVSINSQSGEGVRRGVVKNPSRWPPQKCFFIVMETKPSGGIFVCLLCVRVCVCRVGFCLNQEEWVRYAPVVAAGVVL